MARGSRLLDVREPDEHALGLPEGLPRYVLALTLALGMGFSLFFWLVIVPWKDRDPRK